jgi:hypothetical protein
MQLFVVHVDHHAPHHDRPQLPVQTQTPLESRPPFRLKPHWTTLCLDRVRDRTDTARVFMLISEVG